MPRFKESLQPLQFCRRTHDFKYSAPQAFHSPQILPFRPCHCSLAPGTTFSHAPPPTHPPHLFPRLKAGRVLQQGWLAGPSTVFFFFAGGGDYAPSIGHAPKPLYLMHMERRGKRVMERKGGGGRRGRGILTTVSLEAAFFFFLSQVVLISGAHVCECTKSALG